jgi:hypothetical protein
MSVFRSFELGAIMKNRFLLLFTLALAACDSSIKPEEEDPSIEEDDGGGRAIDDDGASGTAEPGEPVEETIDASSETDWTFFDLETAQTVTEDSGVWELGLRRYTIKVNGGVSGQGGVMVAVVEKQFSDVKADTAADFMTDVEDGEDQGADPDYVFTNADTTWFDYDPASHKLTPRGQVYVVKSVEGNVFKVEITSYYNEAGSSGYPKLRLELLQSAAEESLRRAGQP